MTSLEKLLLNLETEINKDTTLDRQMRELHLQILDKIKVKPLPHETSGRNYLNNPGKEEQIKTEFIFASAEIGCKLAIQNLENERFYEQCHEFTAILRRGMEAIGRDIGINYARILYPEFRHLRNIGEKIPFKETPAKAVQAYSFTLRHYKNHCDLGPLIERESSWKNSIIYDAEKERFSEEFVFTSLTQADAMHGAWERFIAGKTSRPPVTYCLTIRHEADETSTILSLTHALLTAKSSQTLNPDGTSLEKIIFKTPFEAEEKRMLLSKLEFKIPEQPTRKEPLKPQEKNRGKDKINRQHSHQKEQSRQPQEITHKPQTKEGRSV